MNLILLHPADFLDTHRVRLHDRRHQHIMNVHRAEPGRMLKVGEVNGLIGQGQVMHLSDTSVELDVRLQQTPPTPLPVTLVLALPRPKMLRRIVQSIASMGVKTLHLMHSYRVEKSYWSSPFLAPDYLQELSLLGLEQGVDTQLPTIHLHRRFKPFVEDQLPGIIADGHALLAHPGASDPGPALEPNQHRVLIIGPEGGFIPYEVELLRAQGCHRISLGERILRVETAIPFAFARCLP